MPANKLAESKRVAGEVGDGGQAKVCGQGPAGAVGKFLSFYLLFHVLYTPQFCIPESAIWGLRAF